MLDSSFISFTIMLIIKLLTNLDFNWHDYLTQILPDIFSNMWFVPVYVLFYCASPLLKNSINYLNERSHLSLCVVTMIVYGFLDLVGLRQQYCELIGFILTFFFVSYVKIYMPKFCDNKKYNIICFAVLFIIYNLIHIYKNYNAYSNFYILNFASSNGVHIFDIFINFDSFFNPVLTPMLMCLFNVFNNTNIESSMINKLSSCSLFVYCIHENILLRTHIRTSYYEYMLNTYGYNNYFLIMMSCFVGMLIGGFVLALLYKNTLHRLALFLSEKIEKAIDALLDNLVLFMKRFQ